MKHKKYISLLAMPFLILALMTGCGNDDKKKAEQKPKVEKTEKTTPKEKPPKAEPPKTETVQEVKEVPVKKHKVQEGEWLYDLSRKYYGRGSDWEKIYNANKEKINQPDLIYPQQELIIPE